VSQVEYDAQVASASLNGPVKLRIGDVGVSVVASFDAIEVPFVDINDIAMADFVVRLQTDGGDYVFTALGNWCQPFYDALCEAFGDAVRRAMFVTGAPANAAHGDYRVVEGGSVLTGTAPVFVFDDCVVALPPNLAARRIPLCFMTDFAQAGFETTLRIGDDEAYTFAKLGTNTDVFNQAVTQRLRALREKTLALVGVIDPSLSSVAASQLARLLPSGVAAPMSVLAGIAPSFVSALEARLAESAAAEEYPVYKELSDRIWIGMREQALDDYLMWLIVASPDGQHVAVEFAQPDMATFVYHTHGDCDGFVRALNRSLEAISFRREVIWTPEIVDYNYRMAIKRLPALRFVRANFAGRAIHTAGWQEQLKQLWSAH